MQPSVENTYRVVRFMFLSSIVWLLIGMTFGLILALKYIWPEFLTFGPLQKYLQYGRIRPIHTNIVLLGWLTMAYLGAMFYIIPALTKTPLQYPRLAMIGGILWNVFLIVGAVVLMNGMTDVIEYAEFPYFLDIVAVILMGVIATICFATIVRRREKKLYVSLWYFMGSLLWLPLLWIVGNLPPSWIPGVPRFNMSWFYGHNVIGLWFTTVGVGILYYLLPKLANNPLYSHRLSLIGFWTIAAFYVWNGPHHIQNGPVPAWLMKSGVIPSVLMIIPVWTVVANFFGTMKGKWHVAATNIPLRFLLTGVIFYLITCLQGPFQSLMGPSSVIKFTNWVVGHAHLPLFGAFSLVSFAAIYTILPKITGRPLYSTALMNAHFWLSVSGFLLFAFSMWTAGLIQGFAWMSGKQYGPAFVEVLVALRPYTLARALGGALMVIGQFLFAYNVIRSLTPARQATQPTASTA